MGIQGKVIVRCAKIKAEILIINDVWAGLRIRIDMVEEKNGRWITLKVPRMWSERQAVTDTKAAWEV